MAEWPKAAAEGGPGRAGADAGCRARWLWHAAPAGARNRPGAGLPGHGKAPSVIDPCECGGGPAGRGRRPKMIL